MAVRGECGHILCERQNSSIVLPLLLYSPHLNPAYSACNPQISNDAFLCLATGFSPSQSIAFARDTGYNESVIRDQYETGGSNMMDLTGRKVLITGAGGGIGLAIALRLSRAGMKLCLCGRDEKKLHRAAEACGA